MGGPSPRELVADVARREGGVGGLARAGDHHGRRRFRCCAVHARQVERKDRGFLMGLVSHRRCVCGSCSSGVVVLVGCYC
jgi:hypothetical protein